MNSILGIVCIFVGLAFSLVGCIGVIRFPDIYTRLQAATKCITLGTCGVLVGTILCAGWGMIATKCAVCMLFILITSPTAAHALARGSHAFGVKLWEKSVINKYDEDHLPGADRKSPE
jgi:multicomponent Na+:H+ antiporter subunit G